MHYTRLSITCAPEFADILTAELAEAGFDTFMETETGIEAYAEGENYDASLVNEVEQRYQSQTELSFTFDKIEKKNWNEEWEKNYQPIDVEGQCLIRAEFHKPEKQYPFEIIITPKMSFGTGHHQTTYLMIKNQLTIDHKNKRVMDAGCGTAILSVMACKLGAKEIEAFDIDEWSVINGNENAALNHCSNIHIQQGKINEVNLSGKFDIVLANINKNVLLQEIKIYSTFLITGSKLLLSGFYAQDIPDLIQEASRHALIVIKRDEKETWASLLLEKK